MRLFSATLLGYLLIVSALAGGQVKVTVSEGNLQKVSLGDVAEDAVNQSKLTLPGSKPFHLKAKIVETTNPSSDYKADIEEYWVSPEKWQRTITAPAFSQTLIVNGDRLLEQDKGDYLPFWLSEFITAIDDPLPMLAMLKQSNAQMAKPSGSENSTSCARFQLDVGVFCFKSSRGLLDYVVTPGYSVEFKDYKQFENRLTARRIVTNPEPGTTIEATITKLEELTTPAEEMFSILQSTPLAERLRSVRVSEATARALSLSTPDLIWAQVGGKTNGRLALYISVDRSGQVREVWPEGSDNADLDGSAREQVLRWHFRPANENGVPVQMESVLTFAFDTKGQKAH